MDLLAHRDRQPAASSAAAVLRALAGGHGAQDARRRSPSDLWPVPHGELGPLVRQANQTTTSAVHRSLQPVERVSGCTTGPA
jgi:hypothetical protein